MTLLEIVRAVAGELSLTVPVQAIGDPSQDTQQLVSLANACGRELAASYDWQGLIAEQRVVVEAYTRTGTLTQGSAAVTGLPSTAGIAAGFGVAGDGVLTDTRVLSVDSPSQVTLDVPATATGSQSLRFVRLNYPLPADYLRLVSRTQWDRGNRWESLGPTTPQNWAWFKAGFVATGPRIRWRLIRNGFEVYPFPADGVRLTWEYVSDGWVNRSTGGTARTFAHDADTTIYADALFVCMLRMKYLVAKGLDASVAQFEYQRQLDLARSQDSAAPTLRLNAQGESVLIGHDNIPDSGYGL